MAESADLPRIVPLPEFEPQRKAEIAELLVGAVDLHCHSGPAAMPRILDHHEALMDAAEARFQALLYKDHFYPGMAHARILEKLVPDTGVKLFSGLALNNASGGINPHAVDHAIKLGAKIIWMPTLSAKNHLASAQSKSFPKTAQRMLDAMPLSVLDDNGKLTDDTRHVLDLIAAADIILAGGHLHASELAILFDEGRKRGVKKMLVNHPTYIIGCSDDDIRDLVGMGAHMEHSICMFITGRAEQHDAGDIARLVKVAGIDRTCFCSDLDLTQGPKPVNGYRMILDKMLNLQMSKADIKKLISTNAASLLNLQ